MESIQDTGRKTRAKRILTGERPLSAEEVDGGNGRPQLAHWETLYPVAAEYMGTFGARVRYKIDEAATILGQLRGGGSPFRTELSVDGLLFALTRHIALDEQLPPARVEAFLRILAPHLHYRYDSRLVGKNVLWSSMNSVSDLVRQHRQRGQTWQVRDLIRHVLGSCVLDLDPGDEFAQLARQSAAVRVGRRRP